MSQATKRKHVTREVLNDYILPNANQTVVKILATKGNNLHEVMAPNGDCFLVSMPQKFRKNVWIKRGDYIIIEPIAEGDRVKGEIVAILYKDQIRYIQNEGRWPVFSDGADEKSDTLGGKLIPDELLPPSDSDQSDVDYDAVVNPNRRERSAVPSSSDSDDSEECGNDDNDDDDDR